MKCQICERPIEDFCDTICGLTVCEECCNKLEKVEEIDRAWMILICDGVRRINKMEETK